MCISGHFPYPEAVLGAGRRDSSGGIRNCWIGELEISAGKCGFVYVATDLAWRCCRFELMDVLAEPQRLQEVLRERRPGKVFVDIGGNRELPALVALLPALHQAGSHPPPHLVVPHLQPCPGCCTCSYHCAHAWSVRGAHGSCGCPMPYTPAGVAGVYVKSQALVKSSLRHLRALDGGMQPACSASGRAHHTAQHVGRELPEPAASGVDDIARELVRGLTCMKHMHVHVYARRDQPASKLLECGCGRRELGAVGVQEATTIGDGVGDTGGDRDDGAADTCADRSDPERGDVRRAWQRRGGPRAQATPRRVLWRWCNQNMPSAWDLDLDLADGGGDGGRDGAAPLVREGLAVVRNSCEWWRQLVRLLVERMRARMPLHGVHASTYIPGLCKMP